MNEKQILTDLLSLLSEEELIHLNRRAQNAKNLILQDFLLDRLQRVISQPQEGKCRS
jgi:hypothetical protein